MSDDEVGSERESEGSGLEQQRSSTKTVSKKDDEEEHNISFSSYQLFTIVSCYIAYAIVMYNRKAFTFTLPHIIMEEYFSSYEIGMILSAQTFTYTISKFICSWATDHYPPRMMLSGGLFFTGFVMLAFSDQEDWPNIMLLTAANGLVQGLSWPAVTKMIRAWFPPTQFGFAFAMLSTASNVVATVGPGIASSLAVSYGWRAGLQIPAVFALIGAAIIPFCTWDKPSDVGYEDQLTMFGTTQGHWSDLAGSEFMFFLTTTYCLMYIVKTSCQDWGQQYLLQERGLSAYSANTFLSAMEIGGLVGSVLCGLITDFMIRSGYDFGTGKSQRMTVVQFCVAASCMFLNLFLFTIDADSTKMYMSSVGFVMGFSMYGVLSLVATIAIEVAPIHITGSAQACIGLSTAVGAIVAGVPISHVAHTFDWFTAFVIVDLACLAVFLVLMMGKDSKATFINRGGGPAKLRLE